MEQLQRIFDYNGHQVRTVVIDGELWFVAKDVCEVFGDKHYRRSISRLDDDEKGVTPLHTPGGVQRVTVVNESGLYSLLFQMQPQKKAHMTDEEYNKRVTTIKQFKRWVTHEVLPSIRKHGTYMTPETIEKVLLNPDTIIKIATQLKEEQEKRKEAERIIEEQRPKVIFADAVSASESSILVGELAKLLKQNGVDIGQNRLFEWMRENGYLIKRKGTDYHMPTQRSMELGLFEIKETSITHSDGRISISKTPKVTGKGQLYFINKFRLMKGAAS